MFFRGQPVRRGPEPEPVCSQFTNREPGRAGKYFARATTETRVSVRNYLLAPDQAEQVHARTSLARSEDDLNRLLGSYADSLISDERDRRLYTDYKDLHLQWSAEVERVMAYAAAGRREDALTRFFTGAMPGLGVRTNEVLTEWIQHNERLATSAGHATLIAIDKSLRNLLIALAATLVLSGLLGFLTFRSIVHPIRALQKSVESIAAGDYLQAVPFTQATDETGSLARSVAVLKQGAEAIVEQRWVKANIAKLAAALQAATSHAEFGQRLLSGLVPVLGGGVAPSTSSTISRSAFTASRLMDLAKARTPWIRCASVRDLPASARSHRAPSALTDLPPDYLRISSGLGGAAPVQAAAWPLISQDSLLGVIEFGSFRPTTPARNVWSKN